MSKKPSGDNLDTLIARLANLAHQPVGNIRAWVIAEATKDHVRPLTWCKQRLHMLASRPIHALVHDARHKMHSTYSPGEQRHAAHAIQYAIKHHCTLEQAYEHLHK